MYNKELKENFVRSRIQNVQEANAVNFIFDTFGDTEELLDRDLCTFSVDEFQPVIDTFFSSRSGGKWIGFAKLREYIVWCIENGYPNARDELKDVYVLELDKYRKQMVSDPQMLQSRLNDILEPEELLTTGIVRRCLMWLAFAGMPEEDAALVKCDDVDLVNMCVILGDRKYPIYPEALSVMIKASQMMTFQIVHPHYETTVPRVPGNQLLRGIRTDADTAFLTNQIAKTRTLKSKVSEIEHSIGYSTVLRSGYFYRVYIMEQMGIAPDFSDVVDNGVFARSENESIEEMRQKRTRRIRNLLGDYYKWKAAFNLI